MAESLVLTDKQAALVKAMYLRLGMTVDQLAYSPQFELLHREFIEKTNRLEVPRGALWRWLANARKVKKLPKLNLGGGNPPVDGKAR